MTKLDKIFHKTFVDCLKLKSNETLMIVVDKATHALGKKFFEMALTRKFEAVLLEIDRKENPVFEPSLNISKIVQQAPVVLLLTSHFLIHSNLIKQACHNGARVLCANFHSRETFTRLTATDFLFIQKKSTRIADLFAIGKQIELKTPAGTKLSFKTGGLKIGINTAQIHEPGKFDYLPAGEANITPEEYSAQGILVVDGSVPPLFLIDNPITLHVKNGYAYKLTGGDEADILRKKLKPFGKGSRNIAEFGIGTNPAARLTGTSIEDEKVLGTAHIALGESAFEGGCLKKHLHIDMIFRKPTVTVDGYVILKNGRLMV